MSNAIERFMEKKVANPFREFSQLQESFDRMMGDFMNLKRANGVSDLAFSPSCEVAEVGNSYVMKFDLPGISKDQVKVEIDDNQLSVWAERKEEKKHEDKKRYLSEVCYGSYSRSFTLPGPVDEKKVDAKFENGVLTITVPKTEQAKSKQIPIQ